jgi:regulator of sigma E protease
MIIDFLNHLWPFLLCISLLVAIHEFGHYYAAIMCKAKVEVFSIGFGPKIFSKVDKNGTRWQISLLPLGGYIKMMGEYEFSESSSFKSSTNKIIDNNSIQSKSPLQKIFISIGGPAANFISAIVFACILGVFFGEKINTNIVESVSQGSIAESKGIMSMDKIESMNGESNLNNILEIIRSGSEAQVMIDRNGEKIEINLEESKKGRTLGIGFKYELQKLGFMHSINMGINTCFFMAYLNFYNVYKLLTFEGSVQNLAGPVKIAQIIKSSPDMYHIIYIFIAISIGLACMNMIPIPGLDGGSILINIVELITRKSVSNRFLYMFNLIGFLMIGTITLFVLWNDISQLKFIKSILS